MYLPLPIPEEMAEWDRLTMDELGILPEILMENASREALNTIKFRFENFRGGSALVFAGSGNNGGDAFALARHLWNHDVKVMILHSKRLKEYAGAAAYHLSLVRSLDIPLMYLHEYNLDFLKGVDIIVDGLLGTGFSGQLRDSYIEWIKAINKLAKKSYVISLDIPSGIDGITGKPSPVAVRADDTITFEEAKLGLLQPDAREYVGCLSVGKIGIPKKIKRDNPPQHFALNIQVLDQVAFPKKTMHKGEGGHVLVVGGSSGLSGAAVLSALGALRAGAGLVTIACPGALAREIRAGWPEIMVLPLGDSQDWHKGLMQDLVPWLPKFSSVIVGPGMGRSSDTAGFIKAYLDNIHPRSLFDADALYFFARDKNLFKKMAKAEDVIFTPHPGEMARFFDTTATEVNRDRTHFAREFIRQFGGNLVLKGACTIIAGKESPFYVSPFAVPNLAVGGAGDVLAGVIGSLMGQNLEPVDAANIGVYWHGLAGKELAKAYPFRGNLAREIADALPGILAKVRSKETECCPDSLF
ncbi:bifunctional ADP-dependent NAD(P)H-hydrate dehydratase/NAD(P)H-hydrate epimerase [Desulfonatronovibrio hydrogenovorans]|uniref:bifunctional ADP-dependent NAD(P)H-hydrate dehydratase/NAD(P)H-hydrate epimerase n=1 Tax=Desulfonatronovibrio hydrogenovorans TaxID=53245 RepID=UPI00048E3ABD|nr:bifunctional ADP-dependent NAD(P)H-hydrate dehydratase/NAD(P)H-hydrate epimerase [Desulfonatronovibrio hydrogenovorans]